MTDIVVDHDTFQQPSTNTVLDTIIYSVRNRLVERQQSISLEDIQQQAAQTNQPQNFEEILENFPSGQVPIIAEVKRKSPSKGILEQIDDPVKLAQQYETGQAVAISVLTEEDYFDGSLGDLEKVTSSVTVPVLRKDFMVDPYQFYEARAFGADIVLLIVAALSDDQLRDFLDLAHSLGLNALVETHTPEEIDRALAAGAKILGINVRNLKTLDIDPTRFAPLCEYAQKASTEHKTKPWIVAESGVESVSSVRQYTKAGADAVLIGQALVKTDNPIARLTEFIHARAISATDEGL